VGEGYAYGGTKKRKKKTGEGSESSLNYPPKKGGGEIFWAWSIAGGNGASISKGRHMKGLFQNEKDGRQTTTF